MLWSDPEKDTLGWGENDRGVSFTFGADVVQAFLAKHDLDLVCRAHQARGRDFDSGSRRGGRVVFVFDYSVPVCNLAYDIKRHSRIY